MIQSPAGYQGDVRIKRYLDFYQAGYGVAMLSSGVAFSPLSLFANGEQGGWYDPSDLTTLYQDAAGTTPVTAVEQPVGRVLDKSGRGNHLSQSTAAARPVLSARVNALVQTEAPSSASWNIKANISISSGVSDPDGGTTAFTVTATAADGRLLQSAANLSGSGIASIWMRRRTGTGAINWEAPGVGVGGLISLTSSWQRVSYTSAPPGGGTWYYGLRIADANDAIDIWHPDLRPANAGVGLPAYQRVGAATDYDTTGFPLYLKFDGTDDFLQSSTITPGSVDKAQVFAGVRKLSDGASAILAEYGTDAAIVNGSLALFAPAGSGANKFQFTERGSIAIPAYTTSATYNAPTTNVIAGIGDISGDTATLRINSAQIVQDTGDQGTGNFASLALYVGRRGGATLPLNANLYSLILRFSAANLDAATITATETWVNSKTLAY